MEHSASRPASGSPSHRKVAPQIDEAGLPDSFSDRRFGLITSVTVMCHAAGLRFHDLESLDTTGAK